MTRFEMNDTAPPETQMPEEAPAEDRLDVSEDSESQKLREDAEQNIQHDIQQGPDETEEPSPEEKYKTLYDQHLRLAADFENFRKRVASERQSLLKYGAVSTIDALLPVMDNLDRAVSSLSEESDPKMLYQSFSMLSTQLVDTLSSAGLKKMVAIGEKFDPARHEAVAHQPASAEHPENTVMFEQQAGYQVHDRVIRPAQVIVAHIAEPAQEKASEVTPPVTLAPKEMSEDNPFAESVESVEETGKSAS